MKPSQLWILLAVAIVSPSGDAANSVRPHHAQGTRTAHWSPETRALHEKLKSIQGKALLFGHQNATWEGSFGWHDSQPEGTYASDVLTVSGDYPAVYGWDLLDLSDDLRRHIVAAHERGGVNTISWHMPNPVTGGSYSDTTRALGTILPGGPHHLAFRSLLDRAGAFLDSLRDSRGRRIPIIFRPFHEHNGYWFWWCLKHGSADDFAAVFRYTVDYLVKEWNLDSLLIAYSPDATPVWQFFRPFEGYPGDDLIDVVGLDMYGDVGRDTLGFINRSAVRRKVRQITSFANARNKLAAITETGLEGITDKNWWTRLVLDTLDTSSLSYLMVWRNAHERSSHFYAPKPGHPSTPDFLKMKASGKVWFNRDLASSVSPP